MSPDLSVVSSSEGARGRMEIAQRIVDALLNEDDISNATHGNYDAETFRIRLGAIWRGRVAEVLDAVLPAPPREPGGQEREERKSGVALVTDVGSFDRKYQSSFR